MADLKFQPVRHDHKAFLEKASKRRGFSEAYEALKVEYAVAHEMLAARARAGLTPQAPIPGISAPMEFRKAFIEAQERARSAS